MRHYPHIEKRITELQKKITRHRNIKKRITELQKKITRHQKGLEDTPTKYFKNNIKDAKAELKEIEKLLEFETKT